MLQRRATPQSWSWTIRRFGSWREFLGRAFRTGSRTLRRSGECSSRTNRGRDFVIDARTNTVVAQIELGGEAGNTQYDAGSHCIIVAVQTANQLAFIDPATSAIVRRITLDKAVRHPHGVYIDATNRLAFIAGEE